MQTMPLALKAEVRDPRQQGWQQLDSVLPSLVDSHLVPPPPGAAWHGGCSGNGSVFQLVVVFHWPARVPIPCHGWGTPSWVGRRGQRPFRHDRHPWPLLTSLTPQHSNPQSPEIYKIILIYSSVRNLLQKTMLEILNFLTASCLCLKLCNVKWHPSNEAASSLGHPGHYQKSSNDCLGTIVPL